jgi:cell division protein FtsQ
MTFAPLRALTIAAAVLIAAGAGFALLRDSSLVEVREVSVTGAVGHDAAAIREALTVAALDMTTLNVREDALRTAAEAFPVVRDLRARAELPHGLVIEVDAHEPVVALEASGQRTAVAADGTVLADTPTEDLPILRVRSVPAGDRVADARSRATVALLAAAPRDLRARVERVARGDDGLTAAMSDGPRLIFGSQSRAEAKWIAASAVLADAGSKGASYVDVRLPERPVAGGVAPIPPLSTSTEG